VNPRQTLALFSAGGDQVLVWETLDSLAARAAGCTVGGWKRMGLDQERLPFHDMKLHPYGGTPTSALRASKAGPTSARWPCEDLRRDRLKTDAATRDRFQLAAPLRAQGTEIAECPVVIFPQTSWWSEARLIWTSRWDFPVPSARLPNNHISSTLSYLLVQAARSRSQSSSISSRRAMRSTRQAGRNMARKRWFLFLRFTPLPSPWADRLRDPREADDLRSAR